jgi:adenylate cyclase, class 2
MPLEREIKLRFDSAEEARARVLALGAVPLLGRRLQEDCLLDTEDERLRRQRSTLRVRSEGGKSLLTFKGPAMPGLVKIREELETVVSDGAALQTILEELGLHVWFRYEKYREEFSNDDVVIAVDETPVGVFVEIEGGEDAIHETARALGRSPADYITDSYRFLFLQHRDANGLAGHDMVFAGLSTEAPGAKVGRAGE